MPQDAKIIQVPNPLKAKVSYGPDGVDPGALDHLEASVVSSLKAEYVEWARRDVERLQEAFGTSLDVTGKQRLAAMRAVFEIAHDVKGQGGSFGYALITVIAHQLCRFVEDRQTFSAGDVEVVRLHIDALRVVLSNRIEGDGGAAGDAMVKGLRAVIDKANA